ncbi:AAA family ATPase [Clostridium ljungdahlii]|uniref:Bacterial transcriptional activator domain protein n=1 Tax=Clostridium ljungdahlii TaxID=1538 RepID=A0A170NLB5_9CLOT|nr:AAA family ATPase [Clostridium ljungdahlii]OAA92184.1 Bacterial transcriptional activator domain protein [Clostridium ljungdahlii]
MTIVSANLFGVQEVLKDQCKIYFPYKKAEALFYYMLVKEQVSREIVTNLLWGNMDECVAKKNLRNAVYSIKRIFNEEIIVSPKRSLLILNPSITFQCDIYRFLDKSGIKEKTKNSSNELEIVKAYKGDFLEGFYVKNAEAFEEWMLRVRGQFKQKYINKLTKCTESFMKVKDINGAKNCCEKLFCADDFNEQTYRLLMSIYEEEGEYGKAIYTYNVLKQKLKNELDVFPDEETNKLYKKIIKRKMYNDNSNNCGNSELFYGREEEMSILMNNYKNFIEKDIAKSILIKGEAGIGKTRLVYEFLNKIHWEDLYVISANCYQAEEEYILKPWNIIFQKIFGILTSENIELPKHVYRIIASVFPAFDIENIYEYTEQLERWDTIKYQAIESAAIDIIKRMCNKKRMILFFDDVQWMDQVSLSLVKNIMLNLQNRKFMIIFTCRNGYDKRINNFISFIRFRNLINEIEIKSLNTEETIGFVKLLLPDYKFSKEELDNIYLNTEGNMFFLVECLNNFKDKKQPFTISSRMQDILETRLYSISDRARRLLSILSIFFDMVRIEEIQELVGDNHLEMIDSISELEKKGLIKEIYLNDEVGITFNHIKMREYVYSQLSSVEKSFLHKRAAVIMENKLKNNVYKFSLYSKLIYHYRGCGNKLKELEYTIKNLNIYLSNKHEIFPILYNTCYEQDNLFSEEEIKDKFKEINSMIKSLKSTNVDKEKLRNVQMEFFYMVGRNCIRKGEYEKGFSFINDVIHNSIMINNYKLTLQCYKQMIYYSINIANFPLMKNYIDKAIEISVEHQYTDEIPVILRLKGYERIMDGKLDEGESLLKEAIGLFDNLKNKEKYILNIAAAYDFIGESKMLKKQYDQAIRYYELAINICLERDVNLGLPIFYTNAGEALYKIGYYKKAYNYIKKALSLYDKLNFVWGRAKAKNLNDILSCKK